LGLRGEYVHNAKVRRMPFIYFTAQNRKHGGGEGEFLEQKWLMIKEESIQENCGAYFYIRLDVSADTTL
jgi:hypothetical protein